MHIYVHVYTCIWFISPHKIRAGRPSSKRSLLMSRPCCPLNRVRLRLSLELRSMVARRSAACVNAHKRMQQPLAAHAARINLLVVAQAAVAESLPSKCCCCRLRVNACSNSVHTRVQPSVDDDESPATSREHAVASTSRISSSTHLFHNHEIQIGRQRAERPQQHDIGCTQRLQHSTRATAQCCAEF